MVETPTPLPDDEPIHPWILNAAHGDEQLLGLMVEKEVLGDRLKQLRDDEGIGPDYEDTLIVMRRIGERIQARQQQLGIDPQASPQLPPEVTDTID